MRTTGPLLIASTFAFSACSADSGTVPATPCFESPDAQVWADGGDAGYDSGRDASNDTGSECTARLEDVIIGCTPDGSACTATAIILDCGVRRQIDITRRDGHPAVLCTRDGLSDPECLTR